jgi:hypothetical protein
LVQKRRRQKDKHSLGAAGEVETLQNQACFDRLAQSNLIGKQDPWYHSSRDLDCNRDLVGNKIHSGARKSTNRTLSQGPAPTQAFHPKIKLSQLINLPDKKTFFGLGKANEIG